MYKIGMRTFGMGPRDFFLMDEQGKRVKYLPAKVATQAGIWRFTSRKINEKGMVLIPLHGFSTCEHIKKKLEAYEAQNSIPVHKPTQAR